MEVSNASINQGKSQVFFFKTSPTIQKNITRILGFQRSSLASKYLGALLVENALHNASWEDLVSKLGRKLSSWKFSRDDFRGEFQPNGLFFHVFLPKKIRHFAFFEALFRPILMGLNFFTLKIAKLLYKIIGN